RDFTSRSRWPRRTGASACHSRRNLQHIADAQLSEQPDQATSLLIGSLVNLTETLDVLALRPAGHGEADLRLFGQEDRTLVPAAVLQPIADECGVATVKCLVAMDGSVS